MVPAVGGGPQAGKSRRVADAELQPINRLFFNCACHEHWTKIDARFGE
jgi:hypothetical protein